MQWIEVCIKTTSQAIELVGERLTMLGFDSFIMDDQDEFHEFLENNKQYWDYVDEGLEKQMQGLSQIRLYLEDSPAAPETISYLQRSAAAASAAVSFHRIWNARCLFGACEGRGLGEQLEAVLSAAQDRLEASGRAASGCTRKTLSIAWRCCWTPA